MAISQEADRSGGFAGHKQSEPGAIRVMRIITRLNIGGPSYQAIYLTERLRDSGFVSELVTGNVGPNEGSMEDLAAERGVGLTRVPGLGREISPKSDGITVARLYKAMRRFRPHVVHTHMAKAGAVGRLAARAARVPAIVHTYHGHVFRGYFSPRKTEMFLKIERTLARWTDRIIVLSEAQREEILGYGVGRRDQMQTIPLGLELEPFLSAQEARGSVRAELGIAPDAPVVGIVARLVPIKAHDLFLKAARLVAGRLPGTQFLIVGDGELRSELEQQARAEGLNVVSHTPGAKPELAPGSCVHFLGFRSDLSRLYADIDVAVVCSHNEGMPVTIIEALAAARPVVATDVGAVSTLVEDGRTGRLVPPNEAETLAEAILSQLTDAEGARGMAEEGRAHVYPRLSIGRLEQDIRTLYSELIQGKRSQPIAAVR